MTNTEPAQSRNEYTVGEVVAERSFHLTREDLVRYAGASNDFNPIHYRDDIAERVGLPGVLAHGMLTMGLALQPLVDHLGDPGRVVRYETKFTKPVIVHPDDGATVETTVTVAQLLEDGTVRFDLTVTFEGARVLGRAQAWANH